MIDKNVPTLYEWCGGAEQIEALFKKFYEHVRVDSVLSPVFAEMPEEHFQTVADFVSEVLGGPKPSMWGPVFKLPGSALIRSWEANQAGECILIAEVTACRYHRSIGRVSATN